MDPKLCVCWLEMSDVLVDCFCHGGYTLDKWNISEILSAKIPNMIESETAKIYKM